MQHSHESPASHEPRPASCARRPHAQTARKRLSGARQVGAGLARTKTRVFLPLSLAAIAGLWCSAPRARAASESCISHGHEVTVSGDFTHRPDAGPVTGAGREAASYREEISGSHFTVSIAGLPAGKYTIAIGEVETLARAPGERVFSVTSGDTTLARDFDIVATAGGTHKVCLITGVVPHEDDAYRGPLAVAFTAAKGMAKFNTLAVRNASGAPMLAVTATDFAAPFAAAATRVPVVKTPPIWRDPAQPLAAREHDLIRRMSLAEKVAQLQNDAPAIPRLGLPAYNYWNEALHGVANNGIATVFPEPIGGASTWNPSLLHAEGHVIGVEGRAKYNEYASKHDGASKWWTGLTFWTPNLNIFRDPRWGRGQETYGEDPFLTGTLGVSYIKGIQGDNPRYLLAMACAKHYAVHSGPEAERHRFDARPPQRDLYETYLPQFQMAVEQGHVGGVMGAYNALYGVPDCANSFLLTDLLRKQWGFKGYVVSDCSAIGDIWKHHHYVKTPEEAAAAAVKAGCDLCCGQDYSSLVRAVQQGLVTEQEIDHALTYALWTRFKLGLFDPADLCPYSRIGIAQNDTAAHRKLALQIARESMVLLKNNGILPLDRAKLKRIAVIGPDGDSKTMLEGNYHGSASHPVSILAGIKRVAGPNIKVTFDIGCPITTDSSRGIAAWSRQDNETKRPLPELRKEALADAAKADLIIYVGGITPAQEGEGFDRESIELPEVQQQLIQALQATGKPVVMVNCSGSAIALPWEAEHLPAILQAWYPGEEGGQAVAEVLFGRVNPSGHLPITFYRSTADLPSFTNYSMHDRTYRYYTGQPLYAFGHGLSYTTFAFNRGRLAAGTMAPDGTAKVSFTVRNTGDRDGDEVAQVYFRHVDSAIPQPKLQLCGFLRVHLRRGESRRVTVDVPAERLRYWDPARKHYVVAPGKYEFLVGAASDDIRLTLPMTIAGR